MRQISLWAKQHKNSARFLVILIKITLVFMAYYAGSRLYQIDIHIPGMLLGITCTISICTAILYPSKKNNLLSKDQLYVRQKSCDFILSACTFILIITIVNRGNTIKRSLLSTVYATVIKRPRPKAEEILSSLNYRDKSSLTRVEKRVLKKEFFAR